LTKSIRLMITSPEFTNTTVIYTYFNQRGLLNIFMDTKPIRSAAGRNFLNCKL